MIGLANIADQPFTLCPFMYSRGTPDVSGNHGSPFRNSEGNMPNSLRKFCAKRLGELNPHL